MADDPIHKLLLGRDPVSGAPLASQPTISRFENGATRTALYRMGRELAACVIERHRRRLHGRARRVTIDLDPTDDLTHGAQQLTFFNGHYGGWCYLPLLGFLSCVSTSTVRSRTHLSIPQVRGRPSGCIIG